MADRGQGVVSGVDLLVGALAFDTKVFVRLLALGGQELGDGTPSRRTFGLELRVGDRSLVFESIVMEATFLFQLREIPCRERARELGVRLGTGSVSNLVVGHTRPGQIGVDLPLDLLPVMLERAISRDTLAGEALVRERPLRLLAFGLDPHPLRLATRATAIMLGRTRAWPSSEEVNGLPSSEGLSLHRR